MIPIHLLDICNGHINPSGVATSLFREDLEVFCEGGFQLSAPFQCYEMVEMHYIPGGHFATCIWGRTKWNTYNESSVVDKENICIDITYQTTTFTEFCNQLFYQFLAWSMMASWFILHTNVLLDHMGRGNITFMWLASFFSCWNVG